MIRKFLTSYFYNQLKTTLAKNFALVDQPGQGVLVLRVALMDATTATPGLRSISVIVPQARILNGAQSLATGSYAFVGSAEAEMMATDGVTGMVLAEAVDKQAGGMGSRALHHSNGVTRECDGLLGRSQSRIACSRRKGGRRRRAKNQCQRDL